jgi:DNA primase
MSPFPDDASRVKHATDIVDLIGGFVPLQRSGSSLRALCPFHDEKTPSFHVFPQSQLFRCFGCNAAGDVLTFVQRHQHVAFRDALEWLADRAGIQLSRATPDAGGTPRKTLYELLDATCAYFEELLHRDRSDLAADLDKRGLTDDVRKEWRIGLAPTGWQTLHERLTARGFSPDAQIAAGVVKRAESGRIHDRFRERVTFPITDVLGRVVAFGARLLPGMPEGDEHGPKYLNSSESEFFQKRGILYGLDKVAKQVARGGVKGESAAGEAVAVMEGYTDVILAHKAGLKTAVATLGTALGKDHAKLLRRYSPRVLLLYDGDEAGLRASERGVGILLEEGLEVRVLALPEGLDPADYVVKYGGEPFLEAARQGVDFLEFLADRIRAREGGLRGPEERSRACDELLQYVTKVDSAVQREFWVRKVALWFSVPESRVQERLTRLASLARPATVVRPPANRTEAPGPAPQRAAGLTGATGLTARDRRAAEELLAGLLSDPSLLAIVRARAFDPAELRDEKLVKILRAALDCALEGIEPDVHAVTMRLGEAEWRTLPAELLTAAPANAQEAVLKAVRYFESGRFAREIDATKEQLHIAQSRGDRGEVDRLQRVLLDRLRRQRLTAAGGSLDSGESPLEGDSTSRETGEAVHDAP